MVFLNQKDVVSIKQETMEKGLCSSKVNREDKYRISEKLFSCNDRNGKG